MMLLLLLAACFALSAEQTTGDQISTPSSPTQAERALMILATTWKSSQELDESMVSPLIETIQRHLQGIQPQLDFHLTLRKIRKL